MTEEQIDKLVWEIHTKADAKRILLSVAAEARKKGIDELWDALLQNALLTDETRKGIKIIAERLKEKRE